MEVSSAYVSSVSEKIRYGLTDDIPENFLIRDNPKKECLKFRSRVVTAISINAAWFTKSPIARNWVAPEYMTMLINTAYSQK